ncbi:echinoidin-like [Diadema antillarum]|uniref:echinoidin-like n=1 Tax=Diadema antillarum TaxID=105358 RepID=UPI003A867600
MTRTLVIFSALVSAASLLVGAARICPTYWTEHNGYCYRHISRQVTWQEAETHCQGYVLPSAADCSEYTTAHLVSIASQSEQDFVYTFFDMNANAEPDARLWIGLNDISDENEFVRWSDGSTAYFHNWNPGQPDNSGDEDCVHMTLGHEHGNKWNDLDCNANTVRHFMCKGPGRLINI